MEYLTRHLNEANETYFEHFRHAMSFSGRMFIGAFACAVHGLVPFVFERTGSSQIANLHERMVVNRFRNKDSDDSRSYDFQHASDGAGS